MRGMGEHVAAGGMDSQSDPNFPASTKPGDSMETAREYGEFSLHTAPMPLPTAQHPHAYLLARSTSEARSRRHFNQD